MMLRRAGSICIALLLIFSSMALPALSSGDKAETVGCADLPLSLSTPLGGDNMYFLPAKDSAIAANPLKQPALIILKASFESPSAEQIFTRVSAQESGLSDLYIKDSISPRAP